MTESWDRGDGARLVEVAVADPPDAWEAAGFTVVDGIVHLGHVAFRLTGLPSDGDRRGITGWTISGLDETGLTDATIDGLPTRLVVAEPDPDAPVPGAPHPNGTIGLDHVVVATPDLERTIGAFAAVGLDCRRIRETEANGAPMRQAFFRLGPTVIEVVSGDLGVGAPATEAPATWFGLAIDVEDLDATATLLGDGLGRVKVAVQRGRRIATFRHKALGLSVAVAAMDHHGDQ